VAVRDRDILVPIVDYGVARRDRPKLGMVSYEELKSGRIVVNDRTVKVSPLSSLEKARKIAEILASWIEDGVFYLSSPVERLPQDTAFKPMKQAREVNLVEAFMRQAATCREDEEIKKVAKDIISQSVKHVVVVDDENKLRGIVTSWDITRAVAENKILLRDVIVRRVITATPDETLESAARKMAHHNVSALPVIDRDRKVLGIITSEDVTKFMAGG
jgi:CBS domain-containing protein